MNFNLYDPVQFSAVLTAALLCSLTWLLTLSTRSHLTRIGWHVAAAAVFSAAGYESDLLTVLMYALSLVVTNALYVFIVTVEESLERKWRVAPLDATQHADFQAASFMPSRYLNDAPEDTRRVA